MCVCRSEKWATKAANWDEIPILKQVSCPLLALKTNKKQQTTNTSGSKQRRRVYKNTGYGRVCVNKSGRPQGLHLALTPTALSLKALSIIVLTSGAVAAQGLVFHSTFMKAHPPRQQNYI